MERSRRQRPIARPGDALPLLLGRLAEWGYTHVLTVRRSEEGPWCSALVAVDNRPGAPTVLVIAPQEESPGGTVVRLEGAFPRFGVVSDGEVELVFDLDDPARPLDRLPPADEVGPALDFRPEPDAEHVLRQGHRLLRGLLDFRQQVGGAARERLNAPNDALLEAAKVLFLASVRHRHGERALFPAEGRLLRLDETLREVCAAPDDERGERAVTRLQAAFDHFKAQPDNVSLDDAGHAQPPFDVSTHLLLSQPRNLRTLLEALPADGDPVLLGRVFERFLHLCFDGRSEGGVYLTPAPVREAMLALAFHDLLAEEPGLLTARDLAGRPLFRFGDPACGSYGFGVRALDHLARALRGPLGLGSTREALAHPWFGELTEHSCYGADSSPLMVTLARVIMALLGAPRAKVFYTPDSLTGGPMTPCSLDLICTEPPFAAPRLPRSLRDEEEALLAAFRTDLHATSSRGASFEYEPTVAGLAMGGRATEINKVWKAARPGSVDRSILFLDRCLQLLKPGGRLLIVLPDGILVNSGDRYVRQYIMGRRDEAGVFHGGKAIVRAVISLPSETLKSAGTSVKASILYLQKRRARPDDPNRFADEPQGPVFMAAAESLADPDDLAKIVAAYRQRPASTRIPH
jgi:type I restriction enzyme M protein